jgi:hypothetical protein
MTSGCQNGLRERADHRNTLIRPLTQAVLTDIYPLEVTGEY